ncbi:sensor domain-containing diguanylate cyclase [Robertmurraya korlensis]|uniref:sensor domain-containing diguanylate cyclase n=1 Tax=Robertmurraya korlensis TaxID=519977 RepID=UPI000824C0D2|nr:sensor domain-containing diguanylate cyclase [Robertmurraya korlensis]
MSMNYTTGLLTGMAIVSLIIPFLYRRRENHKRKVLENQKSFVHIIENTRDFLYYYQVYPKREYKYLSPSAEHFFGAGSIERAFKNSEVPFIDIHPDDYHILEKKVKGELNFDESIVQRWLDKNGEYRYFEEYATPIYKNGKLVAIQGVLRNIDDKIKLEQELQYQISHDSLTGIYNREYFENKFEWLDQTSNVPVAIIICDLDELKYVNDHFGHKEGDFIIKETAGLLNRFSSDLVTVARLGGDEFALILEHATEDAANDLVDQIIKEFKSYNETSTREIKLSIGVSFCDHSLNNMNHLFSRADKNMYHDKNRNKNGILKHYS